MEKEVRDEYSPIKENYSGFDLWVSGEGSIGTTEFTENVRLLKKFLQNFIPNYVPNLTLENYQEVLKDFVDETNNKIQAINQKIEDFAKPEYLTIITNEIIEVYNLNKWCRENNLHSSSMNRMLSGTRKYYNIWTRGE